MNLPHYGFSEIVRLQDGAVEPVIHAVTAEVVCFTTAEGHRRAYHLDSRRIVAIEDAPSCPHPPTYRPGEVEQVSCRELPVYLNTLEGAGAKDCRWFAVDQRRRGYVWFGSAERSYLTVEWPTVGPTAGWQEVLEVSETLRITRVSLEWVCFETAEGPGAFDMSKRRLVAGLVDGCPAR